MIFGELAVSTINPLRRATVKALSDLTHMKNPKKFYTQSSLPRLLMNFTNWAIISIIFYARDWSHFLVGGGLRHWEKSNPIVTDGLREDLVFIIISGEVKISPQGTKNVAFLSSGDIMGQIPDWMHVPLMDQAIAHTDRVLAVGVSTNELDQLFRLYPSFYGTVFKKMKRLESILCWFLLRFKEVQPISLCTGTSLKI